MKVDDYVKIVAVDNKYRYGYIEQIRDRGSTIVISLFDEGISKIAFDEANNALLGKETVDYISLLTGIEKKIIPLLAGGYGTNDIADEMSIHPTTVRAHLRTLRIKLHLEDRLQLAALAPALAAKIEKQAEVDKWVETQKPQNT